MEQKKIRLLFDARILTYYLYKNKNRSGILFVALNLLREFSKNNNIEITLFYEYQMYKELCELQKIGIIPENCKLMDIKDLAIPLISRFIQLLFELRNKYPKGAPNDNIFKKIIRFIAARAFRYYYKYALYLSNIKKAAKQFDVFFSPCNIISPIIKQTKNIKTYLLIHDIIPIKLKEFYKGYENQIEGMEIIVKSINFDDTYFTVSENTKNDIVEYKKGINPEHFVVTYLGANERFRRETNLDKINSTKLKYDIPGDKKYIFSLCTLEPRKNLIFALNNFIKFVINNNINDLIFVLGGASWSNFEDIDNIKEHSELFIKAGYIEDEDIPVLYSGAEMLVYPSLYEGFGMPVLEAMQCGCPVITSNVSSLPEVIGDAGIQINPKSDEEMIHAYEKMYFDNDFKQICISKGIERAKQFSWQKCANIMYEQFCKDLKNENSI